MLSILKPRLINGHTKGELKRNYVGKYVNNPSSLLLGTHVSVFEKGSQGYFSSTGDGWWEHGVITHNKEGKTIVDVADGIYELDKVEVYLDNRYIHKGERKYDIKKILLSEL